MYKKHLADIGLHLDDIEVYETLLQHGTMQASRISLVAKLKRSHVYKILERLSVFGLVIKSDEKNVARFSPAHPSELKNLVHEHIMKLNRAEKSLDSVLDNMISKFNLISERPSVQFYKGKEGLIQLHKDILDAGEDVFLFRSPYDKNHSFVPGMVRKHLDERVAKKIKTSALTALPPAGQHNFKNRDETNLVQRKILPKGKIDIPAQILIYGRKVGITSYKKQMFTTIIDNEDISKSFKKIFDYMWEDVK